MSPRKYDNSRRRAAAESTRARIVEATFDVHGEQGIAAARMEDIAKRAGVSIGTVYRHFPEYEDLVSACKALTWEQIPPPAARELDGRTVTVAQMVDRLVGFYEQTGDMLEVMRRDSAALRTVADGVREIETGLDAWLAAALPDADEQTRAAARALVDHRTWTAMTQAGVEDARALLRSLVDKVTRHG